MDIKIKKQRKRAFTSPPVKSKICTLLRFTSQQRRHGTVSGFRQALLGLSSRPYTPYSQLAFAKCTALSSSFAFTLAETLITLAIIGTVAALTISTVARNAQNVIWKSSAKVGYSKLSRVVSLVKRDEGSLAGYYAYATGTFKPALMRYFNIAKDCEQQECVYGSIQSPIYKSLTGDPADTLHMGNDGQFVTIDGMFFNIQQSSGAGTGASAMLDDGTVGVFLDPLTVIIDINGFNKKPNTYGKDTFAFQIANERVIPMGAPDSACPAPACCNRKEKNNRQGLGCMYYVMQGVDY